MFFIWALAYDVQMESGTGDQATLLLVDGNVTWAGA